MGLFWPLHLPVLVLRSHFATPAFINPLYFFLFLPPPAPAFHSNLCVRMMLDVGDTQTNNISTVHTEMDLGLE